MKNTKVIFRKYKTGEIIALFPQIITNRNEYTITCYGHNGQHGSADYNRIISDTVPATKEEYTELFRELETVGYKNLKIMLKCPPDFLRHTKSIRQIKKGEFFRLKNTDTAPVWIRGSYVPAEGKYETCKYEDVNHQRLMSGKTQVFTGFTY